MLLINGIDPSKEDLLSLFERRDLLVGRTPFTTALVYKGQVCFRDLHEARLKRSFEYLYPERKFEEMIPLLEKSLSELSADEEYQYLRLTMVESDEQVKLLCQAKPYFRSTSETVTLKTAKHPGRMSSLPNFFKYGNYTEAMILVSKAQDEGFDDCLFLDDEGHAFECSTSNIFFKRGNRFFTPPLKGPILNGVTRQIVSGLVKNLEELAPNRGEWESMESVFITSATRGLVPVTKIDTREFNSNLDEMAELVETYEKLMRGES